MAPFLPPRLLAPDPGWSLSADVCIVGSGIAGLSVALAARAAGHSVVIVTKVTVDDGSTRYAQGGIAAVLDPLDTPEEHAADTHTAGVELCDSSAVDVLVREGPRRLYELIARGAVFDSTPEGRLALTREGGHGRARIVHAGGDATGAEVQRALHEAVLRDAGITLVEHAMVLDLLKSADGSAAGITLHVLGEGRPDGVGAVLARAVVLATGGMGRVFEVTTNPAVSTGDGVALAMRAGASIADLEFMQFHPTGLYTPELTGQQALVSEALRGEGAHLVDADGVRFMEGAHPLAELAPRDVVTKAIVKRARETAQSHVYLDARHLASTLESRFPTIVRLCRQVGVDPLTQRIPVSPAAHYASGGVVTDLQGRTSIPGLYACGEVACTGVHGANRLASNSLLEGLVFAGRIGEQLVAGLPPRQEPLSSRSEVMLISDRVRPHIASAMTRGSGVFRTDEGLTEASDALKKLSVHDTAVPCPEAWEVSNLLTVASAMVLAADERKETRGCHWREDFPQASGEWRTHTVMNMRDGVISTSRRDKLHA